MKIFEHFYKKHVVPLTETIQEVVFEIVTTLIDIVLVAVLWITVPIWIVPFKIIQRMREKR